MPTKQKTQATHVYTQRLMETCTDTKRHKHMKTQKCKTNFKHNKTYRKQIQYK